MLETQRGQRYIVIDNFLSDWDFTAAQTLLDSATFTVRPSVLSDEDGPAYKSRGLRIGHAAANDPDSQQPQVYRALAEMVRSYSDFFGESETDWDRITFAFWKYPAGSRLGWHNDAGLGRQGEFILFLHDRWRPSWGGELMLLDENPQETLVADERERDLVLRMETRIDRSNTSPTAILPKPNRLVMVKSDTVHTIRRVDYTAKDAMRRTLTGFVSKSPSRERNRSNTLQSLAALFVD